eukprot:Cvel_5294.t1-p1 / transcript=Cvel_5294.t1 / gene=Cvel_5294 / organism=Chromera_velia_CCMP2878 / gene_product=Dynein heavy chain 6, axonemal, putative / transcript_product=Dynein heavy chain 6, axonemal, putative / location=Cvel_scaffold245:107-19496(-) / protein_length=4503 / sequence_SO=supercontig / SO=protein_coding / is_pseudo=false
MDGAPLSNRIYAENQFASSSASWESSPSPFSAGESGSKDFHPSVYPSAAVTQYQAAASSSSSSFNPNQDNSFPAVFSSTPSEDRVPSDFHSTGISPRPPYKAEAPPLPGGYRTFRHSNEERGSPGWGGNARLKKKEDQKSWSNPTSPMAFPPHPQGRGKGGRGRISYITHAKWRMQVIEDQVQRLLKKQQEEQAKKEAEQAQSSRTPSPSGHQGLDSTRFWGDALGPGLGGDDKSPRGGAMGATLRPDSFGVSPGGGMSPHGKRRAPSEADVSPSSPSSRYSPPLDSRRRWRFRTREELVAAATALRRPAGRGEASEAARDLIERGNPYLNPPRPLGAPAGGEGGLQAGEEGGQLGAARGPLQRGRDAEVFFDALRKAKEGAVGSFSAGETARPLLRALLQGGVDPLDCIVVGGLAGGDDFEAPDFSALVFLKDRERDAARDAKGGPGKRRGPGDGQPLSPEGVRAFEKLLGLFLTVQHLDEAAGQFVYLQRRKKVVCLRDKSLVVVPSDPYDLEVVAFQEISKESFVTLSTQGVSATLQDGKTETTPLADFIRERELFWKLRRIPVFRDFHKWRPFRIWKLVRSRQKMSHAAARLEENLLCLRPSFRAIAFAAKDVCMELEKVRLVDTKSMHTRTASDFIQAQRAWRLKVRRDLARISRRLHTAVFGCFSTALARVSDRLMKGGIVEDGPMDAEGDPSPQSQQNPNRRGPPPQREGGGSPMGGGGKREIDGSTPRAAMAEAVGGSDDEGVGEKSGGGVPLTSARVLSAKTEAEVLEILGFPSTLGFSQRSALRKFCAAFVRLGFVVDALFLDAALTAVDHTLADLADACQSGNRVPPAMMGPQSDRAVRVTESSPGHQTALEGMRSVIRPLFEDGIGMRALTEALVSAERQVRQRVSRAKERQVRAGNDGDGIRLTPHDEAILWIERQLVLLEGGLSHQTKKPAENETAGGTAEAPDEGTRWSGTIPQSPLLFLDLSLYSPPTALPAGEGENASAAPLELSLSLSPSQESLRALFAALIDETCMAVAALPRVSHSTHMRLLAPFLEAGTGRAAERDFMPKSLLQSSGVGGTGGGGAGSSSGSLLAALEFRAPAESARVLAKELLSAFAQDPDPLGDILGTRVLQPQQQQQEGPGQTKTAGGKGKPLGAMMTLEVIPHLRRRPTCAISCSLVLQAFAASYARVSAGLASFDACMHTASKAPTWAGTIARLPDVKIAAPDDPSVSEEPADVFLSLAQAVGEQVRQFSRIPKEFGVGLFWVRLAPVRMSLLRIPAGLYHRVLRTFPVWLDRQLDILRDWVKDCEGLAQGHAEKVKEFVDQKAKLSAAAEVAEGEALRLRQLSALKLLAESLGIVWFDGQHERSLTTKMDVEQTKNLLQVKLTEMEAEKHVFVASVQHTFPVLRQSLENLQEEAMAAPLLSLRTAQGLFSPTDRNPLEAFAIDFTAADPVQSRTEGLLKGRSRTPQEHIVVDPPDEVEAAHTQEQLESLAALRSRLDELSTSVERNSEFAERLDLAISAHTSTDFSLLAEARRQVEARWQLWDAMDSWAGICARFASEPWVRIDVKQLQAELRPLLRAVAAAKESLPENPVTSGLSLRVQTLWQSAPLLKALQNPKLKERHWTAITQHESLRDHEQLQVNALRATDLLELGFLQASPLIRAVSHRASAEAGLVEQLERVDVLWKKMKVPIDSQKQTGRGEVFQFTDTEELAEALEEASVIVARVSSSRFASAVAPQLQQWSSRLDRVRELLSAISCFRPVWARVDTLLSASADFRRQLAGEAALFTRVDRLWRSVARDVCGDPRVCRVLRDERERDGSNQRAGSPLPTNAATATGPSGGGEEQDDKTGRVDGGGTARAAAEELQAGDHAVGVAAGVPSGRGPLSAEELGLLQLDPVEGLDPALESELAGGVGMQGGSGQGDGGLVGAAGGEVERGEEEGGGGMGGGGIAGAGLGGARVCEGSRLPSFLLRLHTELERLLRGLEDFAEAKRQAFCRFYFLPTSDLLKLLGHANQRSVLHAHINTLFEGVEELVFSSTTTTSTEVQALRSGDGEMLLLPKIRTRSQLELWMASLESSMVVAMQTSLAKALHFAVTRATTALSGGADANVDGPETTGRSAHRRKSQSTAHGETPGSRASPLDRTRQAVMTLGQSLRMGAAAGPGGVSPARSLFSAPTPTLAQCYGSCAQRAWFCGPYPTQAAWAAMHILWCKAVETLLGGQTGPGGSSPDSQLLQQQRSVLSSLCKAVAVCGARSTGLLLSGSPASGSAQVTPASPDDGGAGRGAARAPGTSRDAEAIAASHRREYIRLQSLILLAVHHRDVTADLLKKQVASADAFEWQRVLRHYWTCEQSFSAVAGSAAATSGGGGGQAQVPRSREAGAGESLRDREKPKGIAVPKSKAEIGGGKFDGDAARRFPRGSQGAIAGNMGGQREKEGGEREKEGGTGGQRGTRDTSPDWEGAVCSVWQMSVGMPFGFEFLGSRQRLAMTGATDRFWIGITQAMSLQMGAALLGPAGAGKSYAVRMLAAALGRVCVVRNCAESVDISGVNSAIFGIVQMIRQAQLTGAPRFELSGRILRLQPSCGFFGTITEHAGTSPLASARAPALSRLPDNLRALLRPVSLVSPEPGQVAEALLLCGGFAPANVAGHARKVVGLQSAIASDLVRSRPQLTFALRFLKSLFERAAAARARVVAFRASREGSAEAEGIAAIRHLGSRWLEGAKDAKAARASVIESAANSVLGRAMTPRSPPTNQTEGAHAKRGGGQHPNMPSSPGRTTPKGPSQPSLPQSPGGPSMPLPMVPETSGDWGGEMEEVPLTQDEEEIILVKAIEATVLSRLCPEDGTNFAALLEDFFPSACEADDSSENTHSNTDSQQQGNEQQRGGRGGGGRRSIVDSRGRGRWGDGAAEAEAEREKKKALMKMLRGVARGASLTAVHRLTFFVRAACDLLRLTRTEVIEKKALQLFAVQNLRAGCVVVGETGSGKSCVYRVLQVALALAKSLHARMKNRSRGSRKSEGGAGIGAMDVFGKLAAVQTAKNAARAALVLRPTGDEEILELHDAVQVAVVELSEGAHTELMGHFEEVAGDVPDGYAQEGGDPSAGVGGEDDARQGENVGGLSSLLGVSDSDRLSLWRDGCLAALLRPFIDAGQSRVPAEVMNAAGGGDLSHLSGRVVSEALLKRDTISVHGGRGGKGAGGGDGQGRRPRAGLPSSSSPPGAPGLLRLAVGLERLFASPFFSGAKMSAKSGASSGSDNDRLLKWLVLDGEVTASWADDLNSLLDSPGYLTLGSGERLLLDASTLKLIFETESLADAPPSLVSRCGVVHVSSSPQQLEAVVAGWLPDFMHKCTWLRALPELQEHLESLLLTVAPLAVATRREEWEFHFPLWQPDSQIARSLCRLLEVTLSTEPQKAPALLEAFPFPEGGISVVPPLHEHAVPVGPSAEPAILEARAFAQANDPGDELDMHGGEDGPNEAEAEAETARKDNLNFTKHVRKSLALPSRASGPVPEGAGDAGAVGTPQGSRGRGSTGSSDRRSRGSLSSQRGVSQTAARPTTAGRFTPVPLVSHPEDDVFLQQGKGTSAQDRGKKGKNTGPFDYKRFVSQTFAVCLAWALGGAACPSGGFREAFTQWCIEHVPCFQIPRSRKTIFDLVMDSSQPGGMSSWLSLLPLVAMPPPTDNTGLATIRVPTEGLLCHTFLADALLDFLSELPFGTRTVPSHTPTVIGTSPSVGSPTVGGSKTFSVNTLEGPPWTCAHVLFVGGSGLGKTSLVEGIVQPRLRFGRWSSVDSLMGRRTERDDLRKMIDSGLTKGKDGVLAPGEGKKLVMVLDDIHMPQKGTDGRRPPMCLLRMALDHGGFYTDDGGKWSWRRIDRVHALATASIPTLALKEKVHSGRVGALDVEDNSKAASTGQKLGLRVHASALEASRSVSLRLARHFHVFHLREPSREELHMIVGSLLTHFISPSSAVANENRLAFPFDVTRTVPSATGMIVEAFMQSREHFRPSPSTFLYSFGLGCVSRVLQGVALVRPAALQTPLSLYRLITHELRREFKDRLMTSEDIGWFTGNVEGPLTGRFFSSLVRERGIDTLLNPEPGFWGQFGQRQGMVGPPAYEPVSLASSRGQVSLAVMTLRAVVEEYNNTFASGTGAARGGRRRGGDTQGSLPPLQLTLFEDFILSVSRVSRALRLPFGHCLLVGIPGCGKETVCRLAAFVNKLAVLPFGPQAACDEFGVGTTLEAFRLFARSAVFRAGLQDEGCVVLLSEASGLKFEARGHKAEVRQTESLWDDVTVLLRTGIVPKTVDMEDSRWLAQRLFLSASGPSDAEGGQKKTGSGGAGADASAGQGGREGSRSSKVRAGGDAASVMTEVPAHLAEDCRGPEDLLRLLRIRSKRNLHAVVSCAPGAALRERVRRHSALINCATVVVMETWKREALTELATAILNDAEIRLDASQVEAAAANRISEDSRLLQECLVEVHALAASAAAEIPGGTAQDSRGASGVIVAPSHFLDFTATTVGTS